MEAVGNLSLMPGDSCVCGAAAAWERASESRVTNWKNQRRRQK